MSDVAAAKVAKSAPASAAPAPRSQTLREVQPKKVSGSQFKSLGYGDSEIMTAIVPAGMTFAEAMAPIAWTNAAPVVAKDALSTRNMKDGAGTLIFLETEDATYFAMLRIKKVVRDNFNNPCGLDLQCVGPSIDLKTGEARPIDLRTGKAWVDPAKSD